MTDNGLTRFSRLTPLLRSTGKTLDIFVSTIRAFRISMYSFDSMHWLSALVILELHFQWTFSCRQNQNTIGEFNISKPINEHAINILNFYHDTTDVPARKWPNIHRENSRCQNILSILKLEQIVITLYFLQALKVA
jgi:hypothetical protein